MGDPELIGDGEELLLVGVPDDVPCGEALLLILGGSIGIAVLVVILHEGDLLLEGYAREPGELLRGLSRDQLQFAAERLREAGLAAAVRADEGHAAVIGQIKVINKELSGLAYLVFAFLPKHVGLRISITVIKFTIIALRDHDIYTVSIHAHFGKERR